MTVKPKLDLKIGIDYMPIEYDKDKKHHAFEIRTGEFLGMQFVFNVVKFNEDVENDLCNVTFEYNILEDLGNVYDIKDAEAMMGEILNSVIKLAVDTTIDKSKD